MSVITAAGSILSIGSDTVSAPDATLDTYVLVSEVVNIPAFGREYELITHNPIDNRKTFKFKGSFNDGSFELQLGRDLEDTGQDNALTALDSDLTYNFRLTLNDDPANGSGSAPTTFYLPCKVMSFPTVLDNVNSIVAATVRLEVDGEITKVNKVQGV